jgi:hypothetical protein
MCVNALALANLAIIIIGLAAYATVFFVAQVKPGATGESVSPNRAGAPGRRYRVLAPESCNRTVSH